MSAGLSINKINRCVDYMTRDTRDVPLQIPLNRIKVLSDCTISEDETEILIDKYNKKTDRRTIFNQENLQPILDIKTSHFRFSSFLNEEGESILFSSMEIIKNKVTGNMYLGSFKEDVITTFNNISDSMYNCILVEYYNKETQRDEKLTAVRNLQLRRVDIYQGSILEEEDPPLIAKLKILNPSRITTSALRIQISLGIDIVFITSIANAVYNTLVRYVHSTENTVSTAVLIGLGAGFI